MALDLSIRYPGQIDTTDPTGYPYGKPKNKSTALSVDGTPLEKDLLSDIVGLQQALLKQSGITPSGTPDKVGASQYLEALFRLFPAAVDNWSPERNHACKSATLGRMFSIGSTRLGFMTRSGVGGATGPFVYSDFDYRTNGWTETPTASIGSWIQPAYGNGGVLTMESTTGVFRRTSDLGATWVSGGTNPSPAVTLPDAKLHYFAAVGLWQLIADDGGQNYISRDADASGTWTQQVAPAAVLTHDPGGTKCLDIVSNSTECLALFDNGYVLRTIDGINWTAVLLPALSGGLCGIAWSDHRQLWCVAGTSGRTWFSPTGASWTAGPTHSWSATAGMRLACLGGHWVLPASGFLMRFDNVSSAAIRERLIFSTQAGVSDIHRHNDQLVISFVPAAADWLIYKLSNRLVGG